MTTVIRIKGNVQNTFCPSAQDRVWWELCWRPDLLASSQKEGASSLDLEEPASSRAAGGSQEHREGTHEASVLGSPHQRLGRVLSTVTEKAGMGWGLWELRASIREAGMTLEERNYEMGFEG